MMSIEAGLIFNRLRIGLRRAPVALTEEGFSETPPHAASLGCCSPTPAERRRQFEILRTSCSHRQDQLGLGKIRFCIECLRAYFTAESRSPESSFI